MYSEKKVLELIKEAAETKKTELCLPRNQIRELPPEISELKEETILQ
jgi:hypothetical protein